MAQRPEGVQAFTAIGTAIADQVIKAYPGILYSVNLSWTGATADDIINIHDCAAVADITAANRIFTFRIQSATGSFSAMLPAVGLKGVVGLVLNTQAAGGTKLSIAIGFD